MPMFPPVPQPAPINDPETYYKYGGEALDRINDLYTKQRLMQRNAKGPLGKAGAKGMRQFDPAPNNAFNENLPAGDAAYDHVMNMLEAEMEDQRQRESINRTIAMKLMDAKAKR